MDENVKKSPVHSIKTYILLGKLLENMFLMEFSCDFLTLSSLFRDLQNLLCLHLHTIFFFLLKQLSIVGLQILTDYL